MYNDMNGGYAPRPRPQMHDVSTLGLKCAECGVDIKELPFQPSQDKPVYCRDCNRNRRRSFGGPRRF